MGNLRKQHDIWESEWSSKENMNTVPGHSSSLPTQDVIDFIKSITSPILNKKIIDIGCGKGRNSLFLAEKGFNVYGIDYSLNALNFIQDKYLNKDIYSQINLIHSDIDKTWPFIDNYFDFAIDSLSSIDIETKEGRLTYRNELYRTLKPGGIALIRVVSNEDEFEKELMVKHPGLELNSSIWPITGKFQKNYSGEELSLFYKKFKIITLEKRQKKAFKIDRKYTATNFYLIIQK